MYKIYPKNKYLKPLRGSTGLDRSQFLCNSHKLFENEYFVYSYSQH